MMSNEDLYQFTEKLHLDWTRAGSFLDPCNSCHSLSQSTGFILWFSKTAGWAGGMAWPVKELAAMPVVLSLIPETH